MSINKFNIRKKSLAAIVATGVLGAALTGCGKVEAKVVSESKGYVVIFGRNTATIIETNDVEYRDNFICINMLDDDQLVVSLKNSFFTSKPYDEVVDLIKIYKGSDISINSYNLTDNYSDSLAYEEGCAILFGDDVTTLIPFNYAEYKDDVAVIKTYDGSETAFSLEDLVLTTFSIEEANKLASCINGNDIIYCYGKSAKTR